MLEIKDLVVEVEGKKILDGVSLKLEAGKRYVLMGQNGCGKSTLANVLMGHPKYTIVSGKILFDGKDVTELGADERSRRGMFLQFQHPNEVSGVSVSNFLRTAVNLRRDEDEKYSPVAFFTILKEKMKALGIADEFLKRSLNEGFSGGEKKRTEILQLLMLDPRLAILDEPDSGLDIDALKIVAKGVNEFMSSEKTLLLITHYKRILDYITPDVVFVMDRGRIVREGGADLVERLEEEGYSWVVGSEEKI